MLQLQPHSQVKATFTSKLNNQKPMKFSAQTTFGSLSQDTFDLRANAANFEQPNNTNVQLDLSPESQQLLQKELKKLFTSKKEISEGDYFEIINNVVLKDLRQKYEKELNELDHIKDASEASMGDIVEVIDNKNRQGFIAKNGEKLGLKKDASVGDIIEAIDKNTLKDFIEKQGAILGLKEGDTWTDVHKALKKQSREDCIKQFGLNLPANATDIELFEEFNKKIRADLMQQYNLKEELNLVDGALATESQIFEVANKSILKETAKQLGLKEDATLGDIIRTTNKNTLEFFKSGKAEQLNKTETSLEDLIEIIHGKKADTITQEVPISRSKVANYPQENNFITTIQTVVNLIINIFKGIKDFVLRIFGKG